jgi:inorganic pyrophosphatase
MDAAPSLPCRTKAKMEINKERPWNPIAQDVKDGKLRYYPTPSVLHYGAIPRTYEHPKEQDDLTTLVGDGDPVDIVDVSDLPAEPGQVYWVRILGALAMEDDNAADWKIVAIRLTDPRAKYISGACLTELRPRATQQHHSYTSAGEHAV